MQFHGLATFYANLFAKVFCFLEQNDPGQDWHAVAIFESRRFEPKHFGPYEDLLGSARVTRIYLDEVPVPADPPPGLAILQLVSAPEGDIKNLVDRLARKAHGGRKVMELAEELLIRRFSEYQREEIRKMFHLADIRKTAVWKEAHEEGMEQGIGKGIEKGIETGKMQVKRELVRTWLAGGKSVKEIAELLGLSAAEVRRLAKGSAD